MNRNTRFIAPYSVSQRGGIFFRAMIDGEWKTDANFARLSTAFEAAKKAHAKAQRAARKPKPVQVGIFEGGAEK